MRRALIRRLLAERPGAAGVTWVSRFSESFTATQYTSLPSVNAAWVNDHGTNRTGTGGATLGSAGESRSHLTTELSNTQAAQLKILNSDAQTQGIIVRATAGSGSYWSWTGYAVVVTSNNTISIYRANSGSGTLLASKSRTVASGDVLRVEAIDGEITAFLNGTAIVSVIDYTYRGGFVGVFSGGTLDAWGDDFQAFDVDGPYVAQEASAQFTSSPVTLSLTVAAGSMLVAVVSEQTGRTWQVNDAGGNGALRDSQNNTWTELTENQEASNAFRVRISYAKNVVAGATNVKITNAFGGQGHYVLYEVKRADTTAPFVAESYNDSPSGSTTHFGAAPGGLTSSEVGIAIAAGVVVTDRGALTVRSNWRRTTVTSGSILAPYAVIQYRECPNGINEERGEWFQPTGTGGSYGAGVIAYFKKAASSNNGNLNVTLGAAMLAGTGTTGVAGSLSATLGAATLSSTATAAVVASLSATLGAATLAGTGTTASAISGSLNSTLGAATLSSTATTAVAASLSTTLGAANLAGTGTVAASASLSTTLGAATLAGTGTVAVSGTLSTTLGAATLTGTGTVATSASLSATLSAVTLSSTATTAVAASLSATLGAVTLVGTGAVVSGISGSLSVTLGAATLSSTATTAVAASLSATLGAATLASTGTVAASASLSTTLGAVTLSSPGTVAISGGLGVTLGVITLTGSGVVGSSPISGDLNVTLGAASLSSAATVSVTGSLAATLGAATLSSSATVAVASSLAQTLGAVTATSSGTVGVSGSLSKTLDPLTLNGSGTTLGAITGNVNSTLGAVTSTGTGTVAVAASVSTTFGSVSVSSAGTVAVRGSLASTLGEATLFSTVHILPVISGSLVATLEPLALVSVGGVIVTASVAVTLNPVLALVLSGGYVPGVYTLQVNLGTYELVPLLNAELSINADGSL